MESEGRVRRFRRTDLNFTDSAAETPRLRNRLRDLIPLSLRNGPKCSAERIFDISAKAGIDFRIQDRIVTEVSINLENERGGKGRIRRRVDKSSVTHIRDCEGLFITQQ